MRCQRVYLTTLPQSFAYKSEGNKIFMCKNRSAANTIYIQFGSNPSPAADDAWPLGAGETFTLDPAAPADTIWVWADVAGIANSMVLG